MKIRLGFVSNSSSSSYVLAFPKGISKDVICKAKLKLENPPVETLTKAVGYDSLKESIEEFLKDLKIESQTDKETVYEIRLPMRILKTYEELERAVGYWEEEYFEERYGKYKQHFKNYDFGHMHVSNEGDMLDMLIYFMGFRWYFKLHPMLQIVEAD
jgi:hypothetical protein